MSSVKSASAISLAIVIGLFSVGCPEKVSAPPPPPQTPPPPPAKQPNTATPTVAPGGSPSGSVEQPTAPVAQAGPLDDGKKHYLQACANCHGPDGTGAMMRQ